MNLPVRQKRHEYDDDYIWYYCDNPHMGQLEALRACGHPNPTRQHAHQIHNRLREQINNRLTEMLQDSTVLGYQVLMNLAKGAETEAVKLSAAKSLLDYGGRSVKHTMIIESPKSDAELDLEIAELQKEIQSIDAVEGEFIEMDREIVGTETVECPLTGNTAEKNIYE